MADDTPAILPADGDDSGEYFTLKHWIVGVVVIVASLACLLMCFCFYRWRRNRLMRRSRNTGLMRDETDDDEFDLDEEFNAGLKSRKGKKGASEKNTQRKYDEDNIEEDLDDDDDDDDDPQKLIKWAENEIPDLQKN